MKHEGIQAIIGAAIIDAEFGQHLLEDAASVISEYGLTPDEASVVLSLKATTLRGLAAQLNAWIANTNQISIARS
jgi:antitoxin component of RelBE/YafQ-DinJ toxin-antitoxin module